LELNRQDEGPNLADLSRREKLILTGLYLSKYDQLGLQMLGFDSFREAYNVIAYALKSKPLSIKNYRDEFDPLFPNARKGRHKREVRAYCLEIFNRFRHLDPQSFSGLVKSFFALEEDRGGNLAPSGQQDDGTSSFAQRLITGLAAEHYFESIHGELAEFKGYRLENTTQYGCGYDFRLRANPDDQEFLAVEVKGLRLKTGSLAMTPKEYEAASVLRDRFLLFVVRNFRETPTHEIFRDPLSSRLQFRRIEQMVIQVSWVTSI
jgi:hypothetical protein